MNMRGVGAALGFFESLPDFALGCFTASGGFGAISRKPAWVNLAAIYADHPVSPVFGGGSHFWEGGAMNKPTKRLREVRGGVDLAPTFAD